MPRVAIVNKDQDYGTKVLIDTAENQQDGFREWMNSISVDSAPSWGDGEQYVGWEMPRSLIAPVVGSWIERRYPNYKIVPVSELLKPPKVRLHGTLFDGEYDTLDDAVARAVEHMVVERSAADCPYILVKEGQFGNIPADNVIMAWREVLLQGGEPILEGARLGPTYIYITEI